MGERREYAQRYKKLWRSLSEWLKNSSGWKVGGVAKEGSRREGDFKNKSDLDMDFWIAETYEKQKVYDDIIPKLRKHYTGSQVQKGRSENVIKFAQDGLKVDIVLLPKKEFNKKVNKFKT
ncbi:MAG: hypothetical protein HWN80_18035 [Candidatus Lokiarchaeota archaeon]|nr:hypothetical protein [Candidatus Lokiarchaeota archaeon]